MSVKWGLDLPQVHNWHIASSHPHALVHIILREFILDELGHSVLDELMTATAKIFLPGRGQVGLNDLKAFAVSLRGTPFVAPFVHIFTLRNGKVTHFRNYSDTGLWAQQ